MSDDDGNALVEFAVVLPLLITLVMGIVSFGTAFGNYQRLQNSAAAGAQALAVARGNTLNPCTTVSGPAFNTWPVSAQANLKFTVTIAPPPSGTGTTYQLVPTDTVNPTCVAPTTTTGSAADLVQGDNLTVTIVYPCQLSIYGVNFAPNCKLTGQSSEAIQ